MELHAGTQLEFPGRLVDRLPAGREARLQLEAITRLGVRNEDYARFGTRAVLPIARTSQ